MATVALTGENFDQTLLENEIVCVDFWADWCQPCHRFAPIYEEASTRHPDIVFGKVDTEEEEDLAASFRISAIPTFMIFRQQILVVAQAGLVPSGAIDDILEQVKGLDMEEVKARFENISEDPEELRGGDDDEDEG